MLADWSTPRGRLRQNFTAPCCRRVNRFGKGQTSRILFAIGRQERTSRDSRLAETDPSKSRNNGFLRRETATAGQDPRVPLAPRIRESVCRRKDDGRRCGGSIPPESTREHITQAEIKRLPRNDDRFHSPFMAVAVRDRRTQGISSAIAKFGSADINSDTPPSVINNSIGTLRAIFDEAIGSGARFNNPAAGLSRVKIRQKRLELPSRGEFLKFVDAIRNAGARQSKDCANLVCFLAYSGLRIGEAKHVTWADVNFARHQLHVRGDPETATKNGETRFVPMIPELERLLTELRAERANEPANATVMRVFECQNSMTHAATKIGMKRITHHDLRHLFATICIESGVDIPTVSRWLGHKDGGALCMKTYGHLRQDHSLAQARRVSFGIAA